MIVIKKGGKVWPLSAFSFVLILFYQIDELCH
jgi:hypothetical protein